MNLVIFSRKSYVLRDFQGSVCPAVVKFFFEFFFWIFFEFIYIFFWIFEFFFEEFKKCMHERWRKINDRGCQIKRNVFKSGHKMATFRDTHTSSPLGKIDDFTQNVALFFGSYSFSKKNTRHFLWSREKPKNRWYFFVRWHRPRSSPNWRIYYL